MDAISVEEFRTKERRLRRLMGERGFPNLLLASQANFSWLTGGRGPPPHAGRGPAPDEQYRAAAAPGGRAAGPSPGCPAGRLRRATHAPLHGAGRLWRHAAGQRPGSGGRRHSRAPALALCTEEQRRYRESCRLAALALEETCQAVRPGQSEFQVAGLLAASTYERGLDPVLILVASDERVHTRRHALPTGKRVERYAMLVLCARRHGLIAACTRLVHVGRPDGELTRRHRAVATIDAAMIAGTRPGTPVRDIFAQALRAYADAGFPDEWRWHHQGGLIGYQAREYCATDRSVATVAAGQAFAWNPSVAGAKSEDTILVTATGPVVLTETGTFPVREVEVDGMTLRRPVILVL